MRSWHWMKTTSLVFIHFYLGRAAGIFLGCRMSTSSRWICFRYGFFLFFFFGGGVSTNNHLPLLQGQHVKLDNVSWKGLRWPIRWKTRRPVLHGLAFEVWNLKRVEHAIGRSIFLDWISPSPSSSRWLLRCLQFEWRRLTSFKFYLLLWDCFFCTQWMLEKHLEHLAWKSAQLSLFSVAAMSSPVVSEWLASSSLAARGAAGQLACVAGKRITRADVISNGTVIAPILKHMGARLSIDVLTEIVVEFFFLARPRGKPAISSSLFARLLVVHCIPFVLWLPSYIYFSFRHPNPCCSGTAARAQAWLIKRLLSLFTRGAARGHYPREAGMRAIFTLGEIPLPSDPRFLTNSIFALHMPFQSQKTPRFEQRFWSWRHWSWWGGAVFFYQSNLDYITNRKRFPFCFDQDSVDDGPGEPADPTGARNTSATKLHVYRWALRLGRWTWREWRGKWRGNSGGWPGIGKPRAWNHRAFTGTTFKDRAVTRTTIKNYRWYRI